MKHGFSQLALLGQVTHSLSWIGDASGKLPYNRLLSELATNRPGANFLFADRQARMRRVATRPGIDITELLFAEAGAKDKFDQVGLVFGRYVEHRYQLFGLIDRADGINILGPDPPWL